MKELKVKAKARPFAKPAKRAVKIGEPTGPTRADQDSKVKDQKSKTVLLAVSGMSPAILTETVWALANPPAGQEPVIPNEIVVLTTSRGAADLDSALLTPKPEWGGRGVWDCLREHLLEKVPRLKGSGKGNDLLQIGKPRVIELPDI